jgi:hypothetical protein
MTLAPEHDRHCHGCCDLIAGGNENTACFAYVASASMSWLQLSDRHIEQVLPTGQHEQTCIRDYWNALWAGAGLYALCFCGDGYECLKLVWLQAMQV